jgi:uncharacterized protein YktB (UPF0637 family)
MTNPFAKLLKKHAAKEPSLEDQKRLGVPKETSLGGAHEDFLHTVLALIDQGKIDTKRPETFIKKAIYENLSQEWKAKVDMATPNIISLLERIMDLHARPENNASVEMKNLIETLWQAKERIESHADVFIF